MKKVTILIILIISLFSTTYSVGIFTGICYSGCAALVKACYKAAGCVFGTVKSGSDKDSAAVKECNKAFGVCEATCYRITKFLP
jgi:hypothetical protein